MKTVVYLDVLLGVNFIIGWFLLRAAGRLTSASPPAWRMWAIQPPQQPHHGVL